MSNQEKYISERVISQQKWFSKKAKSNKQKYYSFIVVIIVITTSIPVITVLPEFQTKNILIAALGAISAIFTSINMVYDFKNNWLRYRTTSEYIKSEHSKFIAIGKTEKDFNEFVNSIENKIFKTNLDWLNSIKESENG